MKAVLYVRWNFVCQQFPNLNRLECQRAKEIK